MIEKVKIGIIALFLLGIAASLFFVVKVLSVVGPFIYTVLGIALFGTATYKLLKYKSKKG